MLTTNSILFESGYQEYRSLSRN